MISHELAQNRMRRSNTRAGNDPRSTCHGDDAFDHGDRIYALSCVSGWAEEER
jgi:hypothetical protein